MLIIYNQSKVHTAEVLIVDIKKPWSPPNIEMYCIRTTPRIDGKSTFTNESQANYNGSS